LETGLIAGDPDGEVTIAWTIAQQVMDKHDEPDQARAAAAELIAALHECPIEELARLGAPCTPGGRSCSRTSPTPGCPTDPPINLKIKNTKRIARGYRNFANYRLRLLLNHGRIHEDHVPTRIRTRRPRFAA
jgi:transposase